MKNKSFMWKMLMSSQSDSVEGDFVRLRVKLRN